MGSEVAVTRVGALPSTHPGMMDELNYALNIELQGADTQCPRLSQFLMFSLGINLEIYFV